MMKLAKNPLLSEAELIERTQAIEGLSFSQLASLLGLSLPPDPLKRKGFIGKAIELALGTTAGSKSKPDFCSLGIELKTLPINHLGRPAESTFITTIPLLTIHQQDWKTSNCYAKLKRVLWLPIEGSNDIPFADRRIGRGLLWSPCKEDEDILEKDWVLLTSMIATGLLQEIDASLGEYIQIRPKALNGKSLCYGFDESGGKILTMPRGFYLRSSYTGKLLSGN